MTEKMWLLEADASYRDFRWYIDIPTIANHHSNNHHSITFLSVHRGAVLITAAVKPSMAFIRPTALPASKIWMNPLYKGWLVWKKWQVFRGNWTTTIFFEQKKNENDDFFFWGGVSWKLWISNPNLPNWWRKIWNSGIWWIKSSFLGEKCVT